MEGKKENSNSKDQPFMVTLEADTKLNINKEGESSSEKVKLMNKHYSEPKFKNYKEEILKIPKVKQILNMDKYVYNQDIEKRLQLIGTLKNDQYAQKEVINLQDLRKPVQKKSRRHKTNFKIPLTRKNIQSLNNLVTGHIKQNQHYKNEEFVFLKNYNKTAPFDLQKLNFMDQIDKVKKIYKQKYPQFNNKVLNKNKLTLENVILNRNIKREIKLDKKKDEKKHEKNVIAKLEAKKI